MSSFGGRNWRKAIGAFGPRSATNTNTLPGVRNPFSSSRFSAGTQTAAAHKASSKFGAPSLYRPRPEDEDSRIVRPRFWNGKSAVPLSKFNLDCSSYDFDRIIDRNTDTGVFGINPCAETDRLKSAITEIWDEFGFIHCKKTGLSEYKDLQQLGKLIHPEQMKYEAGANERTSRELGVNVYDVGAPEVADLHYHHEMAYVEDSTRYLTFVCKHGMRDPTKGATFVGVNSLATRDIMHTRLGEKLAEKGLQYIRKLPDRKFFDDNNLDRSLVYNFWQTSMMTEDPDEAIAMARSKGLDAEWQESPIFGRYLVTQFKASAFEYDPHSDMNQIFASIADDYNWFCTWPGVGDLPHWEMPLKLNFGDGEVMTREEKQLWVDVFASYGCPIYWEQGDVASICNWRTVHGRPAYFLKKGERRELGVMLGEGFERQGERDDKWRF